MYLASTSQIRKTDEIMIGEFEFPGIMLMEEAGRKSAQFILEQVEDFEEYLILAGPGNNGGDGLVIARHLARSGKSVRVICSGDPEKYKGDAGINYRHFRHLNIPIEVYREGTAPEVFADLGEDTLLIDALLGTGIRDELRGNIAELIAWFRERAWPCIAIDVPSGLSSDSGALLNAPIPAFATLSFALPKICHFVTPASDFCGELVIVDIGIAPEIVEGLGIRREVLTSQFLLEHYRGRESISHKGTFGHAWVAGGSKTMAGAMVLTGQSALQIGAGLCTALIPGSARCALYGESAEVMNRSFGTEEQEWLDAGAVTVWRESGLKTDAMAIGPGMGNTPETRAFLEAMLREVKVPLLLDADALNVLSEHPDLWDLVPENSILTPHPGEMSRLSGRKDVQENRLEIAESFARERKVILILKGAGTLVALPDGRTYVNSSGNAGMATAGSGDVLSGTILGLLAQGYAPEIAAPMGVYLHGKAGDLLAESIGPEGVTASGIASSLSPALRESLEFESEDLFCI